MFHETQFLIETVNDVICLTDLDTGMSITNNARDVIAYLKADKYDLLNLPVIYCDTNGTWDWLQVDLQGVFTGFKSLGGVRDRALAIQAVKMFTTALPRS